MKKGFKFLLSITLLLVFIMPGSYRFVHVLKHHGPFTVTQTHHHHAHNHECPSEKTTTSKNSFEEYEADCPIVEYEIAGFDIPLVKDFSSNIFTPNVHFVLPEQKKSNHFKGKLFHLRAPPFCV